jgi:hypothetical protein
MEKGISNLLVRLTSLLRQSVSHNALKDVNGNATNVADVDAGQEEGYIDHISVGQG